MYFSDTGEIIGKILVTEPGIVARYRGWRDLAARNSSTAEEMAVA